MFKITADEYYIDEKINPFVKELLLEDAKNVICPLCKKNDLVEIMGCFVLKNISISISHPKIGHKIDENILSYYLKCRSSLFCKILRMCFLHLIFDNNNIHKYAKDLKLVYRKKEF